MLASGFGRIVNISTSERTIVRKHTAPYGPTKAFIEVASLVFAQDLIGSSVTVNVLPPAERSTPRQTSLVSQATANHSCLLML